MQNSPEVPSQDSPPSTNSASNTSHEADVDLPTLSPSSRTSGFLLPTIRIHWTSNEDRPTHRRCTLRTFFIAWISLFLSLAFSWLSIFSVFIVLVLSIVTIRWLSERRRMAQYDRSLRYEHDEPHQDLEQNNVINENDDSHPLENSTRLEGLDMELTLEAQAQPNGSNSTTATITRDARTTTTVEERSDIQDTNTRRNPWITTAWLNRRRQAQQSHQERTPFDANHPRRRSIRRRTNQEMNASVDPSLQTRTLTNNTIHLRYGNEFAILDIEELSFQAQLALAILESQRYILETGGYGRPDDDEEGVGVRPEARLGWKQYTFEKGCTTSLETNTSRSNINGSLEDEKYALRQKNVLGDGTEDTCSICLGDYEVGESITELPCLHSFHSDCISTWVRGHVRCPLCNQDLDSDNIRQLS